MLLYADEDFAFPAVEELRDDLLALAGRIDGKLASLSPGRWCYRVNRRP
jgi:hypothetical protein